MTEQTQEQVAKTLEGNEAIQQLLNTVCYCCNGEGSRPMITQDDRVDQVCHICKGTSTVKENDLLTADQSEATLAEMGLQVLYLFEPEHENPYQRGEEPFPSNWVIAPTKVSISGSLEIRFGFDPRDFTVLDGVPVGQRTLANNAALAWCCDNMRAELKLAVEGGG